MSIFKNIKDIIIDKIEELGESIEKRNNIRLGRYLDEQDFIRKLTPEAYRLYAEQKVRNLKQDARNTFSFGVFTGLMIDVIIFAIAFVR